MIPKASYGNSKATLQRNWPQYVTIENTCSVTNMKHLLLYRLGTFIDYYSNFFIEQHHTTINHFCTECATYKKSEN